MAGHKRGGPLSIGAAIATQDIANEQRGLLELIDKLQFAQLDNVKLPQIVVVGDQSAGKSSVLEAITGIPFPREAGACTRFATEIRLRRADEEKLSIQIIPDKKTRSFAEQERLRQFGINADPTWGFDTLMRRAVDQIAPKNIPGRFATGDILVVEKRGPDMPLLTVVDLPGLVKVANNDQSLADIKAINDLSDLYMKSSRTIILAVVGGNQDYVQAPVLTKAREFDPSGARTIGVLTKPDLTDHIGLEDKFIALVHNEDKHSHFELGWYTLLNPGPREAGQEWPSHDDRARAEDEFFSKGKWSTLPRNMCGATALKQKLSIQLSRHIGKHVKTLQKEIQKAHDNCTAELNKLGSGKDTVEEMREELVELCSDSKDLVNSAVHGLYTNPRGKTFFPRNVHKRGTPPQKLRARAVEENRRFAERVRTQGRKFLFETNPQDPQATGRRGRMMTKKEFAKEEVEPLLQQNTGTELPLDYNPRLVYTLFQHYSENWYRLAQEHKDNLGVICSEFMGEVIEHLWPQRMREALRREYLDPQIKEVLQKAQKEVEMLQQDLSFEIQPYDSEYEHRLRQWRAEASKETPYTTAEEVLEKMLIYYELSAKTFISNVITQVIERHLLQGLLTTFSWVKVNRMKDETVLAIAAENKQTRDKRMSLKAKKTAIEEARDVCASLAMRKELRTFDNDDPTSDDSSDEAESNPQSSIRRKQTASSQVEKSSTPSRLRPQTSFTEGRSHSPRYSENDRYSAGTDDGYEFNPRSAGQDTSYNSRNGAQGSWGDWRDNPSTDTYDATSGPPQQAAPPPPPPPRPGKVRQPGDTQPYMTPPPELDSNNTNQTSNRRPEQSQPQQQPSRSDMNGARFTNPYGDLDTTRSNGYEDPYHSLTSPKKQQTPITRKLFGKS